MPTAPLPTMRCFLAYVTFNDFGIVLSPEMSRDILSAAGLCCKFLFAFHVSRLIYAASTPEVTKHLSADCDVIGNLISAPIEHEEVDVEQINAAQNNITRNGCSPECYKVVVQSFMRHCCSEPVTNCHNFKPSVDDTLSKCNITISICDEKRKEKNEDKRNQKEEGTLSSSSSGHNSSSRMTPSGLFGLLLISVLALILLLCATPCRIHVLVALTSLLDLCPPQIMPSCIFSKNDPVRYTQLMHEDLDLKEEDLLDVYSDNDDLPPITL